MHSFLVFAGMGLGFFYINVIFHAVLNLMCVDVFLDVKTKQSRSSYWLPSVSVSCMGSACTLVILKSATKVLGECNQFIWF